VVNISIIGRRELAAYFLSPLAYVVLTAFGLAHGLLFALALVSPMNLGDTVSYIFQVPILLLVLAAPILTMRLLSEETRSGTIESLMTAPVTELEVVLGKFVGALVFMLVMYAPLAGELLYLRALGAYDVGPVLSSALGLFLLTGLFLSVGLLCSSLTRSQVAAAIVSFVLLLGLQVVWNLTRDASSAAGRVLRYVAPTWHYVSFLKGIVDTRDLVYFMALACLMLFLTVKALQLRKWR